MNTNYDKEQTNEVLVEDNFNEVYDDEIINEVYDDDDFNEVYDDDEPISVNEFFKKIVSE